MSHVIEHLHRPKETLQKINRILKPGGKLIVSTPNFGSLAALIFKSYWFTTDSPRHLFLFTAETLSRMLHEAGFGIKKIEYEEGPKVEIKSLYHLFGWRDLRINPFLWHLLKPITKILASFGKSSIIRVVAARPIN
jgi:predicted SAM-dependent methyltransferase